MSGTVWRGFDLVGSGHTKCVRLGSCLVGAAASTQMKSQHLSPGRQDKYESVQVRRALIVVASESCTRVATIARLGAVDENIMRM